MEYEWDEAKRQDNVAKHGVDFWAIEAFVWATAIIGASSRHGESRYVALGYIEDRLHHVVFAERGDRTRIISLRKASPREGRRYAQARLHN